MRNTFYKYCFVSILALTASFSTLAQSWRWAQSGGSADGNFSQNTDENVVDMATDMNGNVYVLSHINEGNAKVGGLSKTSYGEEDVMLSSFNCKGDLRWAKTFGGGDSDRPYALQTDEKGGVYAAVRLTTSNYPVYIDNDAVISQTKKSLFLIKYDTSGVYQWHLSPQADTVTNQSYSVTGTIDLNVDKDGSIFWLCHLPPGQFGGTSGYTVNALGDYILKYDKDGIFNGGFKMDMLLGGGSPLRAKITRNHSTNQFVIAGSWQPQIDEVKIGNTVLTGSMYLCSFNSAGQLAWLHQSSGTGVAAWFYSRPILDGSGNIYSTGSVADGIVFNGYKVAGPANLTGRPIVLAHDQNGMLIWGVNAETKDVSRGRAIALRNSGEIVIASEFGGLLKWPNYPVAFSKPSNTGYGLAVTRLNVQTGKVLGMDSLMTEGGEAYASLLTSDNKGSIYVAGQFRSKLKMNNKTLLAQGGNYDWFVTKYGYDCNCKTLPEPKFAFTTSNNNKDVSFTYTGSTYTSIEWDFGDGATSTQASPLHTYANNSFYQACVKVKNSCGDNIYCSNLHLWPTGVNDIASTNDIAIYPNPATDKIIIEGGIVGAEISVYDLLGQQLIKQHAYSHKTTIDINGLAAGSYLVQIVDMTGGRVTKKLLKR